MSENSNPKTSDQPWPKDYPSWLIEILEFSMEETGMSREEAIEFLDFELTYGSSLMKGYAAKAKVKK